MALKKNMELWQIKEFLEEELKEQIFLEIAPILYIGQAVGGYFGVTRQILCFFDFFGAVYCGYDGKERYSNGAKKIAKTENTLKFMKEVLGKEIDQSYSRNGKYMYIMYRHGLVHLYQPKTIKLKNGRILKWAAYKGERERATISFRSEDREITIPNVRHLGITSNPLDKNSNFLTVSITCLYKDLLSGIDTYYHLLEQDKKGGLLKNWITVANAIVDPEEIANLEES